MAIDTTAANDISQMRPYWDKVAAILGGRDTIIAGGQAYLPKFPEESDKDYDYRLSLAKFTNIYRDVTEGLATKPFESEVTINIEGAEDVPSELQELVENIDGSGNNLTMFSALSFFNAINYAVDWIFIDYPTIPEDRVITRADAKRLRLKPFWTHVLASNVLEVKTEVIGSEDVISYMRIKEPGVNGAKTYIREFRRSGDTVTWSLWETEGDTPVAGGTLSIGIIPMVPVITGRRDGKSWKFFPPMQDAADLQITLYQNETALEYIKTLSSYPMLAGNGMKPPMEADGKTPKRVSVGPSRVLWGVPDGAGNHGTWSYVEPQANSMEFLKKDISSTKQDLRELGRQPLTALSSQLTTVTTSIAAGKARSAVTAWALGLKDSLEQAFLITCMYMKLPYEPQVTVYTGFDNVLDDGKDLDTLNAARDRGDLSQETYWFELKRRKVLSPEFSPDAERERLLDDIPSESEHDPNNENEE